MCAKFIVKLYQSLFIASICSKWYNYFANHCLLRDLKVVILGSSNVGKTALICRYIDGKFNSPSEQVCKNDIDFNE